MTKPNWYSPRLSHELVSRLYLKAKTENIAMTTLVNRIVQTALDAEEVIECGQYTDNDSRALPRQGKRSAAAD